MAARKSARRSRESAPPAPRIELTEGYQTCLRRVLQYMDDRYEGGRLAAYTTQLRQLLELQVLPPANDTNVKIEGADATD